MINKIKEKMTEKIKNKKGGVEGELILKIIGVILVLIMIACILVPMVNKLNKSGDVVNKNYTKIFNGILKAAEDGTDIDVDLELLNEETTTE